MTVFQQHWATARLTKQNCVLAPVHLSIPMQTFWNSYNESAVSVGRKHHCFSADPERNVYFIGLHFLKTVSKQNSRTAFKRSDCPVVVQSAESNKKKQKYFVLT